MEGTAKVESNYTGGFDQVHDFAKSTTYQNLKSGKWFLKLLHLALGTYREKVNAAYFQKKYQGLPPDAIADRRIDLAKKYAALEGASSATAYTVAIAATIGTKGGASPLTIPAALTAITTDFTTTSFLQLRLAYDLSVIYGQPLDYEDPEDLYDLLVLAFGIRAGELFHQGLQKLAPDAVRILIKKTITGSRLEWIKALPVVGKYLLQRNMIKITIPAVGIGLGAGINYVYTDSIGKRAKLIYRARQKIEEVASSISLDSPEYAHLLLQTTWLVINADRKVDRREAWFLNSMITDLKNIKGAVEAVKELEKKLSFNENQIINELSKLPPEHRTEIYNAACVASIIDGGVSNSERKVLKRLAEVCNSSFDEASLSKLAKNLHKNK